MSLIVAQLNSLHTITSNFYTGDVFYGLIAVRRQRGWDRDHRSLEVKKSTAFPYNDRF